MGDSRFVLIGQPVVAPGVCFICKSQANGPFVDTRVSIKWEGAIYVCSACIIDMHNQLPETPEDKIASRDCATAYRMGYAKSRHDTMRELNGRLAAINDSLAYSSDSGDTFVPDTLRVPQDSVKQ